MLTVVPDDYFLDEETRSTRAKILRYTHPDPKRVPIVIGSSYRNVDTHLKKLELTVIYALENHHRVMVLFGGELERHNVAVAILAPGDYQTIFDFSLIGDLNLLKAKISNREEVKERCKYIAHLKTAAFLFRHKDVFINILRNARVTNAPDLVKDAVWGLSSCHVDLPEILRIDYILVQVSKIAKTMYAAQCNLTLDVSQTINNLLERVHSLVQSSKPGSERTKFTPFNLSELKREKINEILSSALNEIRPGLDTKLKVDYSKFNYHFSLSNAVDFVIKSKFDQSKDEKLLESIDEFLSKLNRPFDTLGNLKFVEWHTLDRTYRDNNSEQKATVTAFRNRPMPAQKRMSSWVSAVVQLKNGYNKAVIHSANEIAARQINNLDESMLTPLVSASKRYIWEESKRLRALFMGHHDKDAWPIMAYPAEMPLFLSSLVEFSQLDVAVPGHPTSKKINLYWGQVEFFRKAQKGVRIQAAPKVRARAGSTDLVPSCSSSSGSADSSNNPSDDEQAVAPVEYGSNKTSPR